MSEDKIAKVLGLRPLEEAKEEKLPEIIEEKPLATVNDEDDTIVDIEQARGNIKNIIEQGYDA